MFLNALNSMIALFGCMLIGFLGTRKKVFKEEMNIGFNKLLLNITVPAMFISAMNIEMEKELLKQGSISLVSGFIYHFICVGVAILTMKLFRVNKEFKSIWLFAMSFANLAFLGFPLIKDVFGEEMLFHATLFNISFNVLAFSLGVVMLSYGSVEKIGIKSIVLQPAFIGVGIGLIIFVIPWQLPEFLSKMLEMFGSVTPPLSMFVVGSTLASTSIIGAFKNKTMYLFSFIKLIVIPVIIYYIGSLVINDNNLVLMFMVLAATPSAVLTVILSKRYNGNGVLASEVVFVSTALSVFTLPVILRILS